MKLKNILIIGPLMLLVGLLATACHHEDAPPATNGDVDYYTCTMHPSVHLHDPKAKCPICGMETVPVMKKKAAPQTNAETSTQPGVFHVPVARQQQFGVTYATVEKRPLQLTLRAVGTVASDKSLFGGTDLSAVWVWAPLFQEDLPLVKKGMVVTITCDSFPDEKFSGKVMVVDTSVDEQSRTTRVRVRIENPEFKLRSGMYVNLRLQSDAGEGLTVPANAVLPTGEHNIVFVDQGDGKLLPRFVELGRKYGDSYAVVSGLREGERIVNSANFLIDAEARVQGALKSW